MNLDGIHPDIIRDASACVRRWALSLIEHPDTAPECWGVGHDWIVDVRRRAGVLVHVADVLEALAVERGDL